MTMVSARPNSSSLTGGWTATGGTAHGVLADDSSASFIAHSGAHGVATLGFPAMSVPAGAKLTAAYLRLVSGTVAAKQSGTLRPVLLAVGGSAESAVQTVNWPSPLSTNVVSMGDPSGVPLSFALTPPGPVRIYEATAWLRFVTKPVVSAVTLVSPPALDAAPVVRWDSQVDSDGGAITRFEVAAWTSTMNPVVDPAVWSAVGSGAVSELRLPSLSNGGWKVRVRVAQTVRGELFWSDWAEVSFTLAVPRPGVPVCNPAGEDSLAYVSLQLDETGGSGVTNWWEVQSSPDGVNGWEPVFTVMGDGRVLNPSPGSGSVVIADFEPPNDVLRFYRARAITDNGGGYTAASGWSVVLSARWRSQGWWVKSVRYPGRNVSVSVASQLGFERAGRDGVFQGLGSPEAIVVSDLPGPPSGEIVFDVDEDVDRRKLDELLAAADPVLIQAVPGTHWRDRWVRLKSHSRSPVVDKLAVTTTLERFEWIEVPRPE